MSSSRAVFSMIFILTLFSLAFSLAKGSTVVSLSQLLSYHDTQFQTLFLNLRLPRTLTAFTTGGLLGIAGFLIQLLLQNPLADPYALGVSSGAAFFTLIMMLLGCNEYGLLGGAWGGSLCTIALIVFLAKKYYFKSHALLLLGIALAFNFSAGISLILLLAPNANLHSMLFWLNGDLNDAVFPWSGMIILIMGYGICFLLAPGFTIFARGDQEAKALGLSLAKYRLMLFLLSSLFTATAVTLAGCIGFIGLIVPHLARKMAQYDLHLALPMSLMLGGSLLTIADTLSRSLFAPQQLPVGIMLSLFGVPLFIWLLHNESHTTR